MTTAARPSFADFNTGIIEDFRANGGHATRGPFFGRQLVLLTTRGARTDEPRVTPLVYTRDGDRVIIVASKGGADTHPDWYRNLVADPHVTVEIEDESFSAVAVVVDEPERGRLYEAHAELHPSFHDYLKRTDRVIPVIALERA